MSNVFDITPILEARELAWPLLSFSGFETDDYNDMTFEGLMINATTMSNSRYKEFKKYALKYALPACQEHVKAFIMAVDQERSNLDLPYVKAS